MTEMIETWINDRWPLLLPKHRHDRPEWSWWEAGRLASMWHHLGANKEWNYCDDCGASSHLARRRTPWTSQGPVEIWGETNAEVVYDIGSEEGDFPALFSSWGCDVVLFEPNDRVWPNIKCIWEANDLRPPLATFLGFAGPEDHFKGIGVERFPVCADGEVIGDHGFKTMPEYPEIPVITIDTMAQAVKPPTAITIDCEGAEFEVLLGAQKTLSEHKPKCWISVHPEFAAETYGRDQVLEDLQSLFSEAGYENWRGTFLAMDHEWHYYWGPE